MILFLVILVSNTETPVRLLRWPGVILSTIVLYYAWPLAFRIGADSESFNINGRTPGRSWQDARDHTWAWSSDLPHYLVLLELIFWLINLIIFWAYRPSTKGRK